MPVSIACATVPALTIAFFFCVLPSLSATSLGYRDYLLIFRTIGPWLVHLHQVFTLEELLELSQIVVVGRQCVVRKVLVFRQKFKEILNAFLHIYPLLTRG